MALLILFFLWSADCAAQKTRAAVKPHGVDTYTVYNITGTITQSSEYCGGPAPTEDLVKELSRKKPFGGKKIHIKRNHTNNYQNLIFRTIKANSDGNYCVQLPSGTYCLLLDAQVGPLDLKTFRKNRKTVQYTSEDCLRKWWKTCYYVLTVKDKDITNLNFHFVNKCFVDGTNPCLQYVGPLPP